MKRKKVLVVVIAVVATVGLGVAAWAYFTGTGIGKGGAVVGAPSLSLSSSSGPVGTTITVTGSSFAASSAVTVSFNGATQTTSPSSPTTSATGGLPTSPKITFNVPTIATGTYTVKVTGGSWSDSTTFTVTPQILTLSNTSGPPGTTVSVTGNGFKASASSLTVDFGGTTYSMSGTANSSGVLTGASFVVPTVADISGGYTVAISDGTNTSPNYGTNYTVTSQILSLSSTTGKVGATVTVTGNGFAASSSSLSVIFGGTTYSMSGTTSSTGVLTSASFVVPTVPDISGGYTVAVSDGTNTSSNYGFKYTVTPQILSLSTDVSAPGASVTVTGNGFAASSSALSVVFGGTGYTMSGTTNSSGVLTSASFTVPTLPHTSGGYTVAVSDGTYTSPNYSLVYTITPQILSLSNTTGPPGTTVTVTGNGFDASASTLTLDFGGTNYPMSGTTNATGVLTSASFTVPTVADLSSGYLVVISDGTVITPTYGTNYIVTPQILSLSSTTGVPGTTVTVTGNGFAANASTLTFQFGATTFTMSGTTSATGVLTSASFSVPAEADMSGGYTVSVSDGTNTSPNYGTNYTVTPQILSLSSTTGVVGTTITVTGNGFAAYVTSGTLKVIFGGNQYALTGTTNGSGVLNGTNTFSVPTVPDASGGYTVAATDGTNTTANFGTNFTVTPQITALSETTGHVGDTVTVAGNGFKASQTTSTLSVIFNGTTIALNSGSTTNTSGTLTTATFTVPAIPAGSYTAAATDGTNTTGNFGTNFTVTPQITALGETTGHVGDTVTVSGNGFKASQTTSTLKVIFNGSNITMNSDSTSNASGTLTTATFTVPAIPAGSYTVATTDGTNTTANFGTKFTVTANLSFTASQNFTTLPGTLMGGSLSGYGSSENVTFHLDSATGLVLVSTPTTVTTNSSGTATSFTLTIPVAGVSEGAHTIVGVGNTSGDQATSNSFTVADNQLVFTTSPVSGSSSSTPNLGAITVERETSTGTAITSGSTIVTLTSTSTGGKFGATQFDGTTEASVTIANGVSTATFYYGDSNTGTPTITASDSGFASATQGETITTAPAGLGIVITTGSGTPSESCGTISAAYTCTITGTGNGGSVTFYVTFVNSSGTQVVYSSTQASTIAASGSVSPSSIAVAAGASSSSPNTLTASHSGNSNKSSTLTFGPYTITVTVES